MFIELTQYKKKLADMCPVEDAGPRETQIVYVNKNKLTFVRPTNIDNPDSGSTVVFLDTGEQLEVVETIPTIFLKINQN